VDNAALEEQEDPDLEEEDYSTTTCFIEAKLVQTFSIMCTILPNFKFEGRCIGFCFYANGTYIDGRLIKRVGEKRVVHSVGYETKNGQIRGYCFSDLEIGG
jgi:hypothetical protein